MKLGSLIFTSMYRDSVSLMLLASQIQQLTGVDRAGVVMGTPANLEILMSAGMLPADINAAPDDLLVVVRALDEELLSQALLFATQHISTSDSVSLSEEHQFSATTVLEGCVQLPGANVLSVSTPGDFAPLLVKQGLLAGLHVFCFSDNVALEDEIELKQLAMSRNLLLMGPDCGTSLIDGTPLGFVNLVANGPVGIVSASGTGAQEVMCQLDLLGVGVSQVIGVGGRDMSEEVGGIMTQAALDMLVDDDETSCIVIVGKSSEPLVAKKLIDHARTVIKPVVVCLIGSELRLEGPSVTTAETLAEAAVQAATRVGVQVQSSSTVKVFEQPFQASGQVLGLFTGGTLAAEAGYLLRKQAIDAQVIDLGDDEFTVGRPHPMIDPSLRCEKVVAAGLDEGVGILLVDLVLGFGACIDPATPLAQAVLQAKAHALRGGRELHVVGSICGTPQDQQIMSNQRKILLNAGVQLGESNVAAVEIAISLVKKGL